MSKFNGSIFRSAIEGDDGRVDAGYLALFWIMAVVITAIPFMCTFTAIAMAIDPFHKFDVQGLGIGIGSVCGGFGVAVGAVGAFRLGDKRRDGATTTHTETVTQHTVAPTPSTEQSEPLQVAVVDMPDDKRKPKAKR